MVKVNDSLPLLADGQIDIEQWLYNVGKKGYRKNLELLRSACNLTQLASHEHAIETGESCLHQSLCMVDILADLEVDPETLIAALLYVNVHYAELNIEDVVEQFGPSIGQLVSGVEKMSSLSQMGSESSFQHSKHQIDNMRKMLLAMVDDVRVVLIKLADRLCVLRSSSPISEPMRLKIANEAMTIYAPLAHRLGIGAIKWEMEDLAFRYIQPEAYKKIAQELKSKRFDRDRYVQKIVDLLKDHLKQLNIEHFKVYGRVKHIHSIYRKMMRKAVPLSQIYDATAVRILVDTETQCYEVMNLVHHLWLPVLKEYDDYIVKPKPNGYQSLHTAVEGPEGRVFEVQIRTFEMHDLAEMGVAAHWKYKEGGAAPLKASHERKIEWLRQVLAWHHDMSSHHGEAAIDSSFMEDRVYVFTPGGDILDLPAGVTALDFAYHLHTDIGHRCRGAKVNGVIVPLSYALKTGDKIEILTGKEQKPSRDWINPHLNYLKSSRAKAKVLHWFKMQDFDKNYVEGKEFLDKELKNIGVKSSQLQSILPFHNATTLDELYAALGRGDLKISQIISRLTPIYKEDSAHTLSKPSKVLVKHKPNIRIEGVGNLLTHMARCCQPLPGDDVIGYITIGRGVSIHRQNCANILHANRKQQERFLEVNWEQKYQEFYKIDIIIKAMEQPTLLREVTTLLTNEKAHVAALKTEKDEVNHQTVIYLTLEIDSLSSLSRILNKLEHMPHVLEARRVV